MAGRGRSRAGSAALALALLPACGGDGDARARVPEVERIVQSPAAALLSVHGLAADDVWMVGADDGEGPLVLHAQSGRWTRLDAGVRADLWWVQALPSGSVLAAGSAAAVLSLRDDAFEPAETPGFGRDTVFGVWAASEDDVYAVGSRAGRRGFVWHFDGAQWAELQPPLDVPRDPDGLVPGLFKVWGSGADDVWLVGDRGLVLRGSAAAGFSVVASDPEQRLFTVHGAGGHVAMVGGSGNGFALETDGEALVDVTPPGAGLLQGVRYGADGALWAVGLGGAMFVRAPEESAWQQLPVTTPVQSLHAVWVDEHGGAWSVGGNVLTADLDGGVALHQGSGPAIESLQIAPPPAAEAACPPAELDPAPAASIAWRWDEQLLGAIRRDRPRPLVHARNLFHAAVAMWDAWAAYDPSGAGVVSEGKAIAADVDAARREAISYAAYRVLVDRYAGAAGGVTSLACFGAFMRELGYDPGDEDTQGDTPRALGNRVGRAVVEAFADDGANQAGDYADPTPPEPDNPPLDVDAPGASVRAPGRWQPLVLAEAVTANGIALGSGVQRYEGSHWGGVRPFALAGEPDLAEPPAGIDAGLIDAVVEVIAKSGELDPGDGVRVDASPAAIGGAALGADDGGGHPLNPLTGVVYAARPTLRADYARALVEHWADAIDTPAGHWNRVAHELALDPRFAPRLFGETTLDPLAWDVHVGLALNGALHDAAIAAAVLSRSHMSARPISLVRYLGGLGQRTDAAAPSYAEGGLPLVPGSIELVDAVSSAPGERHAHLRAHIGEVALRVWPGEPGVGARRAVGTRWILAKDWVPYQSRFSVSPPSPGYVALPSALARAASTVLASLTGSDYFPGGLASVRVEPGSLTLDVGPSEPVELEWATYHDAADLAGLSTRWAGTQLRGDDLDGRRVGASAGTAALERARGIFGGR